MRVSTVCTASPSVGKWSSPTTTGPRPPPSSAFSFTAVNHHKAVYFGGYKAGRGDVDDVYIINFEAMVHMIRVHALAKCVDSSNSIQTLEIGHIPMASGILQSYPSHCLHCSNYHSTNLHQEISICCHGVNDVCINNAIGSYKYGNDFTISQKTISCMWFPSLT